MITAISNSNGYNPKVNSANYNSGNETRKANNSSQVIDSFANSKQVSFEGNLAKAGENLLGNAGSKIGGKVRRLGEEIIEAASGAFRKLSGKNELPIADKTTIAPAKLADLIGDAAKDTSSTVSSTDKTLDLITQVQEAGLKISPNKDLFTNGGFFNSTGAHNLGDQIREKVNNGSMDPKDAKELLESISGRTIFGSSPNLSSDISDISSKISFSGNHSDYIAGQYEGSGMDSGDFDPDSLMSFLSS